VGTDTLKSLISKRIGSVYFGNLGIAAHKPTLEGPDMSDLRKITEERKVERESSYGVEKRKLGALHRSAGGFSRELSARSPEITTELAKLDPTRQFTPPPGCDGHQPFRKAFQLARRARAGAVRAL
jgi:hypothetical protein